MCIRIVKVCLFFKNRLVLPLRRGSLLELKTNWLLRLMERRKALLKKGAFLFLRIVLPLYPNRKQMKQSEYEFHNCLFDVHTMGFMKSIQDSIPEFNNYKGLLPKKKLFTWVVIMFDLNSPMRKAITNYYDRKKMCAEIAQWEKNSRDEFDEEVTKLLLGQDEEANKLIVAYLIRFSMPEYLQLIAYLNMSYDITRSIMSGNFDKDTAKSLDYITERVNTLTNIIFGSGEANEIMVARQALYNMAEKERIKLNPENIVKTIKEEGGLPDDFNPYGKKYKPSDIKFISDEGEK